MLSDYFIQILFKLKKQKYENIDKDSHTIHMRMRRRQRKFDIENNFKQR